MSFAEIQRHELGGFFEGEPQYAEPGRPGPEDRFTLAPPDVVDELEGLAQEDYSRTVVAKNGERTTHRLTVAVVRIVEGEPVPHEHDAVRWLAADELEDVDWLEPDRPFLAELAALLRVSA